MEKLNVLDLFSGIAGNTLGLREYTKTIAYCEGDKHAQSVLLSRMADGQIESAPIWDDIKTLTSKQFDIPIEMVIGGFPCQDISVAGKGAGIKDGERSGLFYEVIRLVKELQPEFVFLENVPAIRTRGLDIVLQEFTETGYDCRWTMLSASSIGALHKRERWFLLAYSHNNRQWDKIQQIFEQKCKEQTHIGSNGQIQSLADTICTRLEGQWKKSSRIEQKYENIGNYSGWTIEPNVGRVANGVPFRMDRIKRLGNAVVPEQAKEAFEILIGIK